MKARYTTANGRIEFEVEGETAKVLFAQLASIQEVFDAEHDCGLCGSTDIRLLARKVDDYDFYELACQNAQCRARFEFGQAKKGGALFPKRKDEDGRWLDHRGWARYVAPGSNGNASQVVPTPQTSAPRTAEAYRQKHDDGTPEGMQASLDRLAEIFGWRTTPTRIGPALDQMREEFERNMGQPGAGVFDEMYRAFSAQPNRDKVAYNALIAKLVNHWNEFRRMVA